MSKKRDLKARVKELKTISRVKATPELPGASGVLKSKERRELKSRNHKPHGTRVIKNQAGYMIELRDVSKIFVSHKQKFTALKRVSFGIKRGEFIVILGPSGSGKTTLLNLMSGLDRATYGDIVINDLNIAALSNQELTTFRRNNVSFIFQFYNLLPELNVKDNIEMGRVLQIDGRKRKDTKEILRQFGMEDKLNAFVSELSGGQMQRVSIARALAKNPLLIFADEPTGSLDAKTSDSVLELFQKINRESKTTIVFVTHNEAIAKLATRVLRVKDGEVNFE